LAALFGCDRKDIIKSKDEGPKYDTTKIFIRDWQYLNGKIFDLGRESDFSPGDSIIEMKLYGAQNNFTDFPDSSLMYVDPDFTDQYLAENSDTVAVFPIDDTYYILNPTEQWISFNFLGASYIDYIGAYLIIKHNDGSVDTVGSIETNPIKLKLIYRRYADTSKVTWDYMWRNVYYVGTHITDPENTEIRIYEGETGTEITGDNLDTQNGVPYVQILGLDYLNINGDSIPDGMADLKIPTIDTVKSLLIFPDRHPFDPSKNFADEILYPKVPEIYDYPYGSARPQIESRYYIEVLIKKPITDKSNP
jgi:hypothetical protein